MIPLLAASDSVVAQGFILMLTGMGAVYLFLSILILVMKGAARVVPGLAFMLPDPEPAKPKAAAKPAGGSGAAVALAIAAALKRRG